MMVDVTLKERFAAAQSTLRPIGQEHLLHFYERLDETTKHHLLGQIESIDWCEIGQLIESHVRCKPRVELPEKIEPAPWYPHRSSHDLVSRYAEARQAGERLIRAGKVAAFTVAGGQGSRLGWAGPKGTFPATPIRKLPLFACLAQYIRKVQQKYAGIVPWYIMTSRWNDAETRRFVAKHDHFGLDPANVMMFPQGVMPAMDSLSGDVLLTAMDRLALSPNGHGGSIRALSQSGALRDMQRRGIEQISYSHVDNPLVRVVDPLFIGLHVLDDCEMSSKALPKAAANENVGTFCLADGRVTVIEYSDMPEFLAEQRLDNGDLRYRAGSIGIHVIQVNFVERLSDRSGCGLPFHRATKKVPYLSLETGQVVQPSGPNAVKLEMFVFDALPLCNRSIIYETDRIDEFAPIKNADAPDSELSVDSPKTSRRIQNERAARWLAARGVKVPRDPHGGVDASVEISALTAIEPADLEGVHLPDRIEPGAELVL